MLVSTEWLSEYIDSKLSPNELSDRITMGGVEVEEVISKGGDSILNLAPTPNRGDCLSIIGVAKEVSALTGRSLNLPDIAPPAGKGRMKDWVKIVVGDSKATPRYTSRVVDGVKVGPSPDWLKKRVESAGIRSINNVVDATNYVLMETGQPVHAFDLRFLEGKKLIIDTPKKACKIVALDGVEYDVVKEDILNLDGKRPIGVAGIMGGENSGVLDDTTTLVLESAYFNPTMVRRTSKRTGLASESSRRFEKGVDPEGVISGLHRLTDIILKVAGGTPSDDWVDLYPKPIEKVSIDLTVDRANWVLGTTLDEKTIVDILTSIGSDVEVVAPGKIRVVPSTHRPDLTRPIDLIEEVARLFGYENINETMPIINIASIVQPPHRGLLNQLREILVSAGFFEALTYSFASDDELSNFGAQAAVRLANPLIVDMPNLRSSLVPSLLTVLQTNLNRQIDHVRLFEINRTFEPKGKGLPTEKLFLSGVATGEVMPGHWDGKGRLLDIFDIKGYLWQLFDTFGISGVDVAPAGDLSFLHPAEGMTILYNDTVIGHCGRLHPSLEKGYGFDQPVYLFELYLDPLIGAYLGRSVVCKAISRYPHVVRDVALLVDTGITHKELLQSFNKNVNKIVQSVELFDIYLGKGIPDGKKSMAYRVTFGSEKQTLSDQEVDEAFKALVDKVKDEMGATIR